MKKLSLLLALLMIFSVFATACIDDSDSDTSSEASSAVSTPSEQKPPVFGIQSIGAVKENPKAAVVSSGLKYTIGGTIVDSLYPDI